jgi:hypothetical protein
MRNSVKHLILAISLFVCTEPVINDIIPDFALVSSE